MWYIFPQLKGLGYSQNSQYYGISCLDEAAHYLLDPVLGHRLLIITEALLGLDTINATKVFGFTDAKKLKSCMTLFSEAMLQAKQLDSTRLFNSVLDVFFDGERCNRTLSMLLALQNDK